MANRCLYIFNNIRDRHFFIHLNNKHFIHFKEKSFAVTRTTSRHFQHFPQLKQSASKNGCIAVVFDNNLVIKGLVYSLKNQRKQSEKTRYQPDLSLHGLNLLTSAFNFQRLSSIVQQQPAILNLMLSCNDSKECHQFLLNTLRQDMFPPFMLIVITLSNHSDQNNPTGSCVTPA